MTYKSITTEVCRIAREAGAYLRAEQNKLRIEQVERKHTHDYVSYVDKECERRIVAQLRELLPEADFLTEEGICLSETMKKEEFKGNDKKEYLWVVDPLDGTTNYIHGFNPFAVSIALRKGDHIVVGVVYEVSLDECFSAWYKGGAYLNEKPIHVSKKNIDEALMGIELPYDADMYRTTGTKLIEHFYGLCGGIRMNGSAAMALCNVACGRWDGWLERGIQPWDFMAGALIVEEAGGFVTAYQGCPFYLNGNEVVASNGLIHNDIIHTLELLHLSA